MSSEVSTESSMWYDFLGWFETNKKKLVYAGAGVVGLAFVVSAYRWKVNQTETAASDALLELRVTSVQTNKAVAAVADFEKVARDYSGTAAAQRAALLAAGALFGEGKFAEAQTHFEKFAAANAGTAFAPSAAYGVAASIEAQGKADEALAAYQSLPTRFPKSAVADEARLAAARILESKGQAEAALKIYNELTAPNATSSRANQAAQRKQALLTQHPELAPATNSPAQQVIITPVPTPAKAAAPQAAATNSAAKP